MHKIILTATIIGLGVLILVRRPAPVSSDTCLLGMTEEFVQTVAGTPTNDWVFRCDRIWRTNDSTIQVFEYDRTLNRTLRSTFVGDYLVAVDAFNWQTVHINGAAESRAFHVPVSQTRTRSDIPARLRTRANG